MRQIIRILDFIPRMIVVTTASVAVISFIISVFCGLFDLNKEVLRWMLETSLVSAFIFFMTGLSILVDNKVVE